MSPPRAVLAVQGPAARELLAPLLPAAAAVGRFRVSAVAYEGGGEGWAAGTGYTGEDGVELHVPAESAVAVWRALMDAGIPPAGLGARDTLRLEAGLPLHGHELGAGITPFQAGLGWVVRFDKGDFRGRALWRPRRSAVWRAGCGASSSTDARSRVRDSRCCAARRPSARSPAATSLRCSNEGSRSRS